ncbi:MAG: hypothetical protein UDD43_11175 [Agathobacter sp.]|nr:hypothetical protein [Agathobacter sp.]
MQKNEMMNLIRKAKDRDPDAFTTLMQQQTKDMYRVAIAILMNDEDAAACREPCRRLTRSRRS